MKTLICLLIVVCVLPVAAQKPVQELPELQEWYSLSGVGSGISYLPNFDVENGGKNAIAVRAPGDPTWYNRFAFDTVNQFSWSSGGTYQVAQADFNGDGIKDYMDSHGYVYRGISNGKPPERVPIAQPIEHIPNTKFYVGDFNGDGYEDIIMNNKGSATATNSIFYMVLGSADFKTMRSLWLMELKENDEFMIGAYLTADKQPRLITYRLSSQKGFEGFVLQSINFTGGVTGDTLKVTVTALDSIGHYNLRKDEQPWYSYSLSTACLYSSKKYNEYSLIFQEYHDAVNITRGYKIENDKLQFVDSYVPSSDWFSSLSMSVDGDDKEDYLGGGGILRGSQFTDGYFIISGNPVGQLFKPRGFIPRFSCGGENIVKAIGDVTGDGIGDLVEVAKGGCFTIYKGIDWQTISVTEGTKNVGFTTLASEPNPIGISRTALLPITIEQSAIYTLTLFDGNGKLIGELFKGELPIGEQRIPLNLKQYNLTAGFYNLRISDGKHTRERAILLTNQ